MRLNNKDLNEYNWEQKSNGGIFVEKESHMKIAKAILKAMDESEYDGYFSDGIIQVYDTDGSNFIPYNHKFDFDVDDFIRRCNESGFDVLVVSKYGHDEYLTIEKYFGIDSGELVFEPMSVRAYKEYRHATNKLEKKIHDLFLEQHINNKNTVIDLLPFEPANQFQNYAKDTLSVREKSIMLSTIQWLGTSVGRNFLDQCGYELKKDVEIHEFYKKK